MGGGGGGGGGGGILTGIPSSRHCYSAGFIKCNWEDCSLS